MQLSLSLIGVFSILLLILNFENKAFAAPTVASTLDPKSFQNYQSEGSWHWSRNPDGSYDFDKNTQYVMTKYGKLEAVVTELCAKMNLADCKPYLDLMRTDLNESVVALADTIRYFDQHVLETRQKAAEAAAALKAKQGAKRQ